jgi:outer membrane protein insertion porin family
VNNIVKSSIKIAILTTSILCQSSFAGETIHKITVQGNNRVEISTIKNYLGFKVGDEYSPLKENEYVKNLYATSLFEKIDIKFLSGNLVVTVTETPFISKVDFKGNSKVRTAMLSKELETRSGESLSLANIQIDIEKIKEIYKRSGRFSVSVTPKVEKQENNRVKVMFEIMEGPKTGVKRIYFRGNDNYRDTELSNIILTKESRWFRFLDTNDTYDPDRIEYDKELLREFYQSVGFVDFRIISATAELNPTKEFFTITYSLEEGDKYSLGTIILDNTIPNIDVKEIEKFISVKSGDIFNMKALEKISEKIADYFTSKGYPQVNVYPDLTNKDLTQHIVNVKIVIEKADRVYIGQINIEGNLKTEDKVIRREFKIAEGDIFNRSYIERGERNLRNLDYFEKISTNIVPTNKRDKYDINLEVQEKSTSSIGFDLGYNTAGGPFARLSFLERNLLGTGKYLNAGVQGARKSTNYYLGLTEPHFLDRDLSLSGNVFKSHSGRSGGFAQTEQNYTLKSLGLKTSLGYDITEDVSHEIDHTIKRDNLNAPLASSSRFITEQIGKCTTSAVGQTITYDQTDSRIVPKNGYILSASQEYAGVGGNNKYLKHELDGKYFKSFINNKLTLKLAGSGGDIMGLGGKMVRISDRFNLGDYTLRGFSGGGIGPRDKSTKEGLGGQRYYAFGAELNFPVGMPEEFNLSGALFTDIGSVWGVRLNSKSNYRKDQFYDDKSLRASVGFGFIWITRFAPIRVDWALPVKKKRYDDRQSFHLKFSTHF